MCNSPSFRLHLKEKWYPVTRVRIVRTENIVLQAVTVRMYRTNLVGFAQGEQSRGKRLQLTDPGTAIWNFRITIFFAGPLI